MCVALSSGTTEMLMIMEFPRVRRLVGRIDGRAGQAG
jgi:hypothetical protein